MVVDLDTNGVHVYNPKCIYTSKYIGVSRDEYKSHDVTMATDDVIKCCKKKKTSDRLPSQKTFSNTKLNVIFVFDRLNSTRNVI